jgi:hypothetical protein
LIELVSKETCELEGWERRIGKNKLSIYVWNKLSEGGTKRERIKGGKGEIRRQDESPVDGEELEYASAMAAACL